MHIALTLSVFALFLSALVIGLCAYIIIKQHGRIQEQDRYAGKLKEALSFFTRVSRRAYVKEAKDGHIFIRVKTVKHEATTTWRTYSSFDKLVEAFPHQDSFVDEVGRDVANCLNTRQAFSDYSNDMEEEYADMYPMLGCDR